MTLGVVGIPVAVLGLLGVEAWVAINAEYLPVPDYLIDATVEPGGGAARPLELALFGDSTVAGIGAPTTGQSLPVLVAERVAEDLGRSVHVIGYGVSGARTVDVHEQLTGLASAEADVVVIVVGSNDATHVEPFWRAGPRTRRLLEAAHRQTAAPVVLGGIPQFKTVPALAQPLRWVVGRYASVLRERQRAAAGAVPSASFVDIASEASPRFLGKPESMSADGFHPSEIGYGFWADALAPAVVDAVRKRASDPPPASVGPTPSP